MSLRKKILIVLSAVLCCYAGIEYLVLDRIVYPELEKQEHQQAKMDLKRCSDAIEMRLTELHKELLWLSQSGQLYSQIKSPAANLMDLTSPTIGLDFLTIYDNAWNRTHYESGNTAAEMIEATLFDPKHPIIKKGIPGYSHKSLTRHDGRILFVISAPVTRSSLSQTVEGTVVAGQYLTQNRLENIRSQLRLNFDWDFVNPEKLTGQQKQLDHRISSNNPFDLLPIGHEFLQASTFLYDERQQPALLIKLHQDRTASHKSRQTMLFVLYGKIAAGFVAVFLLTGMLQSVIVNPVVRLIKHIVDIKHPGKKVHSSLLSRKDEIGKLANEFSHMCRRIQNAQVKLVEKSYLSGVAEMSSGILHNVRNALSPITTRIERIKGQFKTVPLDNLEQAQTELQSGSLEPERRRDLMRFVDLTFQDVLTNLNEMVSGLDDLSEQVFQIEDMLNIQRTFGREEKPVEFVDPIELLNKALDLIPEHIRNECRITIDSKIKKLDSVPVEPTTFVQILQNLLINAAESLERQKPLYRKIRIQADTECIEDKPMLHWTIRDNGAGIPEDKIQQIFERGASSKQQGLTGIGLHWCANTLTAMRGRIWAESAGVHRGAEFHILIPMAAEEELVEMIQEAEE